ETAIGRLDFATKPSYNINFYSTTSTSTSESLFINLPEELLCSVLYWVNIRGLFVLSQVNKKLCDLLKDDFIWKNAVYSSCLSVRWSILYFAPLFPIALHSMTFLGGSRNSKKADATKFLGCFGRFPPCWPLSHLHFRSLLLSCLNTEQK